MESEISREKMAVFLLRKLGVLAAPLQGSDRGVRRVKSVLNDVEETSVP